MHAEELIIRIIHNNGYDANAPLGRKLLPACLQAKEFKSTQTNKGASVYLKSALASGITTLEASCPKWRNYGYAEITIEDLSKLGVSVVYSPEDCTFPLLKCAHYSLVGVTHANRDQVVALFESGMKRTPHVIT